jgi:hypothetical protein
VNCSQFENRIQLLLDDRLDPRKDELLCLHARECRECRMALVVYACLDSAPVVSPSPVRLEPVAVADRSGKHRWPARAFQSNRRGHWIRIVAATAALVTVCLLPVLPSAHNDVATSPVEMAARMGIDPVIQPPVAAENSFTIPPGLAGELPTLLPPPLSAVSLANVDFSEWSELDLITLLPEEQVQTVRGIPVTLQTIEPYYRYSVECPVINQWTGGIHFTLNLIRQHLPGNSSGNTLDRDDLGRSMPGDLLQMA